MVSRLSVWFASTTCHASNQLRFLREQHGRFLQMRSPMMVETTQSDGWRRGVWVLIEWVGRGRDDRFESFLV
ncbi:MAG: hypothetical protein COA78_35995 [Blastopirellula sp.]|nr:MAG: hypothetical protein COA78_35995 [Blastopirellula sp.]